MFLFFFYMNVNLYLQKKAFSYKKCLLVARTCDHWPQKMISLYINKKKKMIHLDQHAKIPFHIINFHLLKSLSGTIAYPNSIRYTIYNNHNSFSWRIVVHYLVFSYCFYNQETHNGYYIYVYIHNARSFFI